MRSISKPVAALLAVCGFALIAHSALAAPPAREDGVRVEGRMQTRATTEGLAKAGSLRASRVHAVRLAAPSTQKLAELGRPAKGAPLKIGFTRAVPDLATEAAARSALEWQKLDDGSLVADVSVSSPGAAAVRLGVLVARLPDNAVLRFKGPDDSKLFETIGQKVNDTIARNVKEAGDTDDARTYYSPVVDGTTVVAEIELPPGVDPLDVSLAMPKLSHLVTSASSAFSTPTNIGQSAPCEIDAMCSGPTNQMNAVAEMIFSDAGGSYLCTGTLLADQDSSTNYPYFLTANHCINTQTAASSLVTFWFYRSTFCNSGTPGAYQQLTGGATLLYHSQSTDPTYTDTSFMQLANTPPQGTYYAGWYANSPTGVGATVTGLHHPVGDLLKISGGSVNGYTACGAPVNGSFSCSATSSSASSAYGFYEIPWSSGITEPGSSGSGLFNSSGYVVGQLYGGGGNCTTGGDDAYGRFDLAYNNALKTWLSPPLALNISKSGTGTGTVTSSPGAISCGSTCSATFAFGSSVSLAAAPSAGSTFTGWGGACSGTGACTVAMNSPQSVSASFALSTGTVAVAVTGGGTVTSSPAGISCGSTCSSSYPGGTAVTLNAAPVPGYFFSGWTGACSGSGGCVVTATGSVSVGATFTPKLASSTALVPALNPSLVGQSIVLNATVSGAGGTPTGTVSFAIDGIVDSGCAAVALGGGAASCTVSSLTVGTHSLTATYAGSGTYLGSASSVVTETVSPAGTIQTSVLPTSLAMGGESMGTTSFPQAVVVTNSGAATVTFSSITISGPFAQTSNCASIAPGASCTVDVTFSPPVSAGAVDTTAAASGVLALASNAANSPATVLLSGTGEKSLVTHYYEGILDREPDSGGKVFWQGEAARMIADGVDVNETWYAMALAFFSSPEYTALGRDDTGFVTDLYNTFFDRPPDAGGLAYWTGLIAQGMPREVVLASFLFSTEFTSFSQSIFGTATVRAEVYAAVDFYRGLLGRLPDDAGFAYWLQQFRTAQCQGASAVAAQANNISYAFTTSAEYLQRNRTNAQYVSDMYDTFLRRGGDLAGVQYWIGQLDSGAMTREQVRQNFLASPEFQGRVSAIVAQGCL